MIRLVIADDVYLIRVGLERILADADGIEVVGSARDLDSLRNAIREQLPDAVVTGVQLAPAHVDEGIQVARESREAYPEMGVVMLSQFANPEYALGLLESGAERRAYLLKERIQESGELISAIETVVAGGSVIDPAIVDMLVEARRTASASRVPDLTRREQQVLRLLAQGKNNAAIAASLDLTKRAVEKHINAIFMKLGLAGAPDVSQRVKAALMYLADSERRRAG